MNLNPRRCRWLSQTIAAIVVGAATSSFFVGELQARGLASGPPAAGAMHSVPFFPANANPNGWQGFLRVVNHSSEDGSVSIRAFDDGGRGVETLTLSIGAGETVHFNSEDLEEGNPAKGLPAGTGRPGQGDWRLELASDLRIETMAYVRTSDGMLTAMHDLAPGAGGAANTYRVVTFNPGSNQWQVSRLRLSNPGDADVQVSLRGVDDRGRVAGPVRLQVTARASRTVSALELEDGAGDLDGILGDGGGKWRLDVESSAPVLVMSVLASPTGHLTNLSTVPVATAADGAGTAYEIPFFPAAANVNGWQGFVRVANLSDQDGTVSIRAFDDAGGDFGALTLAIDAGETAHFNSEDLEDGNSAKGLSGRAGRPGEGDWRLVLTSELRIEAMAYVRTADGLLAAMHDVAPMVVDSRDAARVVTFNPGSNERQESRLRLVNPGGALASVSIRGVDDRGRSAGPVHLEVAAGASRTVSALELEGGAGGLDGTLGDGSGKWRLDVDSDVPLAAMSLLASPTGHLTNLSTVPGPTSRAGTADFAKEFSLFDDNGGNESPRGIVYVNGRFHIVDPTDHKVYAYTASGQRDPAADFELERRENVGGHPYGITYANGRFHIIYYFPAGGGSSDKTYAYTPSGQREPTADFEPRDGISVPRDTFFVNGRFHILDREDNRVYAYSASGQRDSEAGFDLTEVPFNGVDAFFTYADGRFYFFNPSNSTVYAFTESGRHDPTADFELDDADFFLGITYTDGRFYFTSENWTGGKVHAYTASGQQDPAADFDLPNGNAAPVGIAYANGRFYVSDAPDQKVYAYTASGQHDPTADFDVAETGALAYANGRLHILRGFSFFGLVSAYSLSGQRDTAAEFQPEGQDSWNAGITFADGRFYIVEAEDRKVYAYTAAGQREPTFDFDLHEDTSRAIDGIAYGGGRLYVLESGRTADSNKVYAYTASGQHDPAADLYLPEDLHFLSLSDIVYRDGRLYIVDRRTDAVYSIAVGRTGAGSTGIR